MIDENNVINVIPIKRSLSSFKEDYSDFFTRDDVLEIHLAKKALEEQPTIKDQFRGKNLIFVNE